MILSTLARTAILGVLLANSPQESKDLLDQFKGSKAELIPVEADAGVQAGKKKDVNLGRNEILEVKDFEDSPESGWVLQRVYLRFKLVGLKPADIKGAHLAVYGNLGDGDKPVDVDVAILPDKEDGWEEMKITWNNQPGPANAKSVGKLTFTYGNTPTRATDGRWYKTADIGDALRAKLTKGDGMISFLLTTKIKEEACLFTREHKKGADCSPRIVILRGKA
jgi:hypothetical protein